MLYLTISSSTLGELLCLKESLILSIDNKGSVYLKASEVKAVVVKVWVRAAYKVRWYFCTSVCDWAACLYQRM